MKKLLSVLFILILIPASVFAVGKIDLSKFSDAELYELLDEIKVELSNRNAGQLYNSIDSVKYYYAEHIMAQFLELNTSSGKSGYSKMNSDYSANATGGIRLVKYDSRIVKVSAQFDLDDSTNSVLRMYLLAAIFENKLYEKESISSADKRSAVDAAKVIVDGAVDSFGMDNLKKVVASYQEGYSLLATTGRVPYYWEYIDGTVWLSITLCNLPEGIY